jgi:hypothetical protein
MLEKDSKSSAISYPKTNKEAHKSAIPSSKIA